jgi:hypothetical protein
MRRKQKAWHPMFWVSGICLRAHDKDVTGVSTIRQVTKDSVQYYQAKISNMGSTSVVLWGLSHVCIPPNWKALWNTLPALQSADTLEPIDLPRYRVWTPSQSASQQTSIDLILNEKRAGHYSSLKDLATGFFIGAQDFGGTEDAGGMKSIRVLGSGDVWQYRTSKSGTTEARTQDRERVPAMW